MAGILAIALITFVVVVITQLFIKYIKLKYAYRGLPEPTYDKYWILGHLPHFQGGVYDQYILNKMIEWMGKYRHLFVLWVGPTVVWVEVHHPESVKKILVTADPKAVGYGQVYRHGIPWLGEGLLIAGGAKWKRSRRLLTPAFHFDILKPYLKIYKSCADLLVRNITTESDKGESVEIFSLVSSCTLDIILRCAFSYETDCQNIGQKRNPYIQAVNDLTWEWTRRNCSPWLYTDFVYFLTKGGKKFKRDCDFVHNVAEGVIEKRRQALKNEEVSSKKYLDFLDILLTAKDEDGNGMSNEDIRTEVDTFLFEGHDTTASAISWILYSLAEHPDHQRKCQEEIDRVVSETKSGELEWKDLERLEYLTRCIKEGMRLHTPVPMILRNNQSTITVDNQAIPAGSTIVINIYSLHHNAEVWGEDHMKFKPERFTKENMEKRDSFAFCPFSAGPRNCIGQNFAMSEEKIVLATLLQRFTFTLDETHIVEKQVLAVMRAKNGIKLFAIPR
ncbi:ultra-long-chain fatty acid omega-hydroxylase-like [Saccostrea cucullata]|uniref:ultra-long-chain fatty acid omega-hydroxylase-like n=1 Tax=Saccostrea cuccullata TaxID=36930 RepID=UPI002ED2334A